MKLEITVACTWHGQTLVSNSGVWGCGTVGASNSSNTSTPIPPPSAPEPEPVPEVPGDQSSTTEPVQESVPEPSPTTPSTTETNTPDPLAP